VFVYELHRRRELTALTARAHQQSIHKNGVLIALFGLHEREENHRLIPLGSVCPPISPIQQEAMAYRRGDRASHDLVESWPFGFGSEPSIKGGISTLRQVRSDDWTVEKPGQKTLVRRLPVSFGRLFCFLTRLKLHKTSCLKPVWAIIHNSGRD